MGKGLFLTVSNQTDDNVKTFITESRCMFHANDETFNDKVINARGSKKEYLEAKGSMSCFFSNSSFTIQILVAHNNFEIGKVYINAPGSSHFNYKVEKTGDGYLIVGNVDNNSDQSKIKITITKT